jgi:hypothetical protein
MRASGERGVLRVATAVLLAVLSPGCRVIAGDLRGGGIGVVGFLLVVSLIATVAALVRRSAG